jgi:hypothetical protein
VSWCRRRLRYPPENDVARSAQIRWGDWYRIHDATVMPFAKRPFSTARARKHPACAPSPPPTAGMAVNLMGGSKFKMPARVEEGDTAKAFERGTKLYSSQNSLAFNVSHNNHPFARVRPMPPATTFVSPSPARPIELGQTGTLDASSLPPRELGVICAPPRPADPYFFTQI